MSTSTCAPDAPLVSVIIPYYNRPTLLSRALLSVERQSYRNIETIVVDDGSPQSPAPLIAELGLSRRVALLRHPVNRGPGAARNTGIDAAAGSLVTFLDSDDEYDAGKIGEQVSVLNGDGREAFCASSTILRRSGGGELCDPWDPRQEKLASFLFVKCGSVTVNSMMVSTTLARRVRFSETLRDFEDNLFAILCCEAATQILYARKAYSLYYKDGRKDQLTNKTSRADALEFLRQGHKALTPAEIAAFHVRIAGDTFFFSDPARFFYFAIRGVYLRVFSARQVIGLIYGYFKHKIAEKTSRYFQS